VAQIVKRGGPPPGHEPAPEAEHPTGGEVAEDGGRPRHGGCFHRRDLILMNNLCVDATYSTIVTHKAIGIM
jgi:hypothetical protein